MKSRTSIPHLKLLKPSLFSFFKSRVRFLLPIFSSIYSINLFVGVKISVFCCKIVKILSSYPRGIKLGLTFKRQIICSTSSELFKGSIPIVSPTS